jgi:hypothetical protein
VLRTIFLLALASFRGFTPWMTCTLQEKGSALDSVSDHDRHASEGAIGL